MPVTRSELVFFGAGLAAGAVAYATYPRWKSRVEPLVSAVVAGAAAAFKDAQAANEQASESGGPGTESAPTGPDVDGGLDVVVPAPV